MTPTIADRVAKGAALMDEKVPEWAEKIDPARLKMESCFDCIIGQIFKVTKRMFEFTDAAETIGLDNPRMIADHGFDIHQSYAPRCKVDVGFEHAGLRAAWLDEIKKRLPVPA